MTDHSDHSDYFGPAGLRVRGTVIVVPGRDETRATYTRFGNRLAADAYRVRVIDAPVLEHADPDASLTAFASRLADAVEGTAAEDGVVRPVAPAAAEALEQVTDHFSAALGGRTGALRRTA